jgi:hypothetical protein
MGKDNAELTRRVVLALRSRAKEMLDEADRVEREGYKEEAPTEDDVSLADIVAELERR